jgi:hypothetical protein
VTALDRYLAATVAWRDANAAREQAARDGAYAVADMAATMPVVQAARRVHLSPARVEQLIAKARQEGT